MPSHLSVDAALDLAACASLAVFRVPFVQQVSTCERELQPVADQPCQAHVELGIGRHLRVRQGVHPAQLQIELKITRQIEARTKLPLIVRIVAQRRIVHSDRIGAAGLEPQVLVQDT